jgi:hypothetical protein
MISKNKSYTTNWWEAYNPSTQPISDYWLQVSRGKMHVLGKAYSVKLSKNASRYKTESEINQEIWDNLNAQDINWSYYDQWTPVWDNGQKFQWGPDGYIDMIYKIYKTRGRSPGSHQAGIASLSGSCTDQTVVQVCNNPPKYIKYGYYSSSGMYDPLCSGIMASQTGDKNENLAICFHEHTHYLYSDVHIVYGRLGFGPGSEGFFSPYEMIMLGYMQPTDATLNGTNYLQDYSSRDNSDGHILKVPINSQTDESFLIVNRSNVSKWDKIMCGDTARIKFYDMETPYGKGIYIYHIKSGIHLPNGNPDVVQDEECADGYWQMSYLQNGTYYAFDRGFCWQSTQNQYQIYKKDYPVYDNDIGYHYLPTDNYGDDKNFRIPQWAAFGQPSQNQNLCEIGLERTFTNSSEYFSFDQALGDRWDAWRVGYNEVFSPYSSPSSNTWENPTNQNSGIFIYLSSNDGTNFIATLNIYKVDANHSLESILTVTPPSRPMGSKHNLFYINNGSWCIPQITWTHNSEPDMEQGPPNSLFKRYQILRATAPNMTQIPDESNYIVIAPAVDIPITDIPHYEDYSVLEYDCGYDQVPPFGIQYPIRYRIKAIDKDGKISVQSDFVQTTGLDQGTGKENNGDNHKIIQNIPTEFNLNQNYPNPFNSITNIKYDLPKDIFVSVKVYDLLGREIKTLVNEFKNAGSHIVSFNGTEFASGIYFYRIQAGSFAQVKRMVLIK